MSPIDAAMLVVGIVAEIAFLPWLIIAIRARSMQSPLIWVFMALSLGAWMCRYAIYGGSFFGRGVYIFEAWFAAIAGAFVLLTYATRPRVPGAVEAAVVTAGLLGLSALTHASASGIAAAAAIASIVTALYALGALVRTFVASLRVAA